MFITLVNQPLSLAQFQQTQNNNSMDSWDAMGPKDSGLMFSNSALSLNVFSQLVLSHQCTLHTYASISKAVASAKKKSASVETKICMFGSHLGFTPSALMACQQKKTLETLSPDLLNWDFENAESFLHQVGSFLFLRHRHFKLALLLCPT